MDGWINSGAAAASKKWGGAHVCALFKGGSRIVERGDTR